MAIKQVNPTVQRQWIVFNDQGGAGVVMAYVSEFYRLMQVRGIAFDGERWFYQPARGACFQVVSEREVPEEVKERFAQKINEPTWPSIEWFVKRGFDVNLCRNTKDGSRVKVSTPEAGKVQLTVYHEDGHSSTIVLGLQPHGFGEKVLEGLLAVIEGELNK